MELNKLIAQVDTFLQKTAVLADPRLKELTAQPSYAAKMRYAAANFKKIGAGSSRVAFEYETNLVLKLAKNDKGLEQNRTEADGFIQQHYQLYVTNVVDSDPNDVWIVTEHAKNVSPSQFKALTGIDFKNFCAYVNNNNPVSPSSFKMPITDKEKLDDSPFVSEILDLMANFQMPPGDIMRIRSWGEANGRVVLRDYGLTNDIYEQHYK